MPSRIVLYGATSYIGGLTAQAMVASGGRPVLVGCDRGRLETVAARLSQVADGAELETVVAGTEEPGPLRELLAAGDVLVSTAGPFLKIGRAAVTAAVDAARCTWTRAVNRRLSVRCSRSSARTRNGPVRCC